MDFSENFLHYVWKFRLFDQNNLKTIEGENLKIIHPGILNNNAGPDFSNAKIEIGNTLWAGNVEIHLNSSDWTKHNHQIDDAYNNVILHVVFINDDVVKQHDGSNMPVLILQNRIADELIAKYQSLELSSHVFPCAGQIASIDQFIIDNFLSRVLIERLEEKSAAVFETLKQQNGNWDETFYQYLAKNFGFKVNALPLEMLAKSIPQNLYSKHKNNAIQIEALIFGVAGFLSGAQKEEYPKKLKSEYDFLKKKYGLHEIDVSLWKFMRMRPQNFPTIRLAQFAGLIVKSNHLFSKIVEINDLKKVRNLFEEIYVNPFWETHYHFNKETEKVSTQIGKSSIDNILINTVVLFLFAYGKYTGTNFLINRAVKLLESIAEEDNAIIKTYKNYGLQIENSFNSQAVLQLKKNYCDQKKCLSCGIGIKILKQSS
jgi:hypothetical protein